MKALNLALLATAANAMESNTEMLIIDEWQVNNRTLLNKWKLIFKYEIDAAPDREPKDNFLTITTILKNSDVTGDFKRRIGENEIFQTYFSIKDPDKEGEI